MIQYKESMKVGDKVRLKNGAKCNSGTIFNIQEYERFIKAIKRNRVQLDGDKSLWFKKEYIILIKD
jgi:hypothetical protein